MKGRQPDFLLKCRRFALVASLWLLLFSAAIAGKSQAANPPIFFQNCDGGGFVTAPTTGGMTGYVNTQSVEGFAGLGTGTNVVSGLYLHNATGDNFTNSPSLKSTIQLSNLPAHSGIQLQFLLAIIDTWDGNVGDFFHVDVDGVSRFKETFYNEGSGSQSYVPPAGVTIEHNVDRAVEGFSDSLYNMGLDPARFGAIPHTASTLKVDFYADGPNWNRPANESWAIDNVGVSLIPVPEPSTLLLAPIAALIFCQRMKKPQR
jgi:hypothetical protein